MEKPLEGHHAVVTGGGRGIGATIACELAALGADVTIMGRNLDRLEDQGAQLKKSFDGEYRALAVDITNQDTVKQAFATIESPSILINNAGAAETATFAKTSLELWQRMIAVNLTGMFLTCQQVLPAMLQAGRGRIVNISSTAGVTGYRYVSAYCASKHGVIGLTRSLALEMASHGITVNAVCPGYTNTDMIAESIARIAEKTGRGSEEIRKNFMSGNPQGRFVEPEEVAKTVAWLCLPEQRSINGQTIVLDGGETA